MPARREVEVEASPEQVWEALVTDERREDWLDEPDRDVHIEVVEEPSRLVWWWRGDDDRPATRVEFEIVADARRRVRDRHRERAGVPDLAARVRAHAGRGLSGSPPDGGRRVTTGVDRRSAGAADDELGAVFAALADPTRRAMIDALLREGETSVPRLSAELPITRQAVAKHLATLDHAGLVERAQASGREVRYRLRGGALESANAWLARAESAWEQRLARLKDAVERAG